MIFFRSYTQQDYVTFFSFAVYANLGVFDPKRKSLYQEFPPRFSSLIHLSRVTKMKLVLLICLHWGRGDKLTNGFGTFKTGLSFLSRREHKLKVTVVYLP